jgi:hypothetical protein
MQRTGEILRNFKSQRNHIHLWLPPGFQNDLPVQQQSLVQHRIKAYRIKRDSCHFFPLGTLFFPPVHLTFCRVQLIVSQPLMMEAPPSGHQVTHDQMNLHQQFPLDGGIFLFLFIILPSDKVKIMIYNDLICTKIMTVRRNL